LHEFLFLFLNCDAWSISKTFFPLHISQIVTKGSKESKNFLK